MIRLVIVLTCLLTGGVASGQIHDALQRSQVARPTPAVAPESVDATTAALRAGAHLAGERVAPNVAAQTVQLPPTACPDLANNEQSGPLEPSGYVRPAPGGLLSAGPWIKTANGRWACATELSSANALALRVRLTGRFGFDGVQLRVYDPVSGAAFGPYARPPLDQNGNWWTTIIFGASIGLEFALPPGAEPPAVLPEISAIAYIYKTPPPALGLGGCVHNDVTCLPEWSTTAQAVTMLSVVYSDDTVAGFCSGALMNRGPGDHSPLVMTANHCVGGNGGQATASSTSFVWLFQTSSCNGAPPNANNLLRSDGSLLVKRHIDSDWNLLGLYEPPGVGSYAGWSSAFFDDGDEANGIHHPGGTFKRISLGNKVDDSVGTFCDANGNNCFDAEIWEIAWTSGFTQPGSSGSPVFDVLHRVRGALSGGPTDDCTISKYGRFDLAYNFLRYYLSSTYIARPMYVSGNVGGDPGNNGNAERGTAALPFNTVYEASFAVVTGDDMYINPGNYSETFTIRRPMTLKRRGSSGVVRIGQ